MCSLLHSDFADLKEKTKENVFDGAYSLEALCHAVDLEKVFSDVGNKKKNKKNEITKITTETINTTSINNNNYDNKNNSDSFSRRESEMLK